MIKKIIFQAEFEGQGIVNFDGDEQRNFLNEHCGTKYFNNNYKLGKKVFRKKENPELKGYSRPVESFYIFNLDQFDRMMPHIIDANHNRNYIGLYFNEITLHSCDEVLGAVTADS